MFCCGGGKGNEIVARRIWRERMKMDGKIKQTKKKIHKPAATRKEVYNNIEERQLSKRLDETAVLDSILCGEFCFEGLVVFFGGEKRCFF